MLRSWFSAFLLSLCPCANCFAEDAKFERIKIDDTFLALPSCAQQTDWNLAIDVLYCAKLLLCKALSCVASIRRPGVAAVAYASL